MGALVRGSIDIRIVQFLHESPYSILRSGFPAATLRGARPFRPAATLSSGNRQVIHLLPLLALQSPTPAVVPADTAWMLVATAMVLLMTPALAFFYGGLVRSKNSLNTMMMSFAALGAVGVVWALLGYSLAFAEGNGWIGGGAYALLAGVGTEAKGSIPHVLFMAYQGTFAIITAALISGAVVERMRFGPYLAFIVLWSLLVYAPVAHWVWGGGWLMSRGVLDFAGGTVVHINAGVSALVAALVLGVRKDYGRQAILPHNVPFVLLGAGLLWFGWFGFNGGSALGANELAAVAFTNTFLAPMATLVVWVLLDYFRSGHATAVGGATAIVIGLVAVTPAAGYISPMSALVLGAVAASELFRDRRAVAHAAGRFAGRVRRPRNRRHHRRAAHGRLRLEGLEPGRGRRSAGRQPGPVGHAGARGREFHRLFGRRHVRHSPAAVAGHGAPHRAPRGGSGAGRHPAWRRGVYQRRGLDPRHSRRGAGGIAGPRAHPPGRALRPEDAAMKLIVAIIRPDRLNEVLEALYRAEVTGLTVSRVLGHGGETDRVETYRGTTVKMELQEKVRLEIGVSEPFVEITVQAILAPARTGEVGDGKVFVLDVDQVYRIRTGERDEQAVTPAGGQAGGRAEGRAVGTAV